MVFIKLVFCVKESKLQQFGVSGSDRKGKVCDFGRIGMEKTLKKNREVRLGVKTTVITLTVAKMQFWSIECTWMLE